MNILKNIGINRKGDYTFFLNLFDVHAACALFVMWLILSYFIELNCTTLNYYIMLY